MYAQEVLLLYDMELAPCLACLASTAVTDVHYHRTTTRGHGYLPANTVLTSRNESVKTRRA